MGLIIDTSVLIAIERKKLNWDTVISYESPAISSITVMEMLTGLNRRHMQGKRVKTLEFVDEILKSLTILPFHTREAIVCAELKDILLDQGTTIGMADLMIAATAIVANYPVMTLNKSDFARIPLVELV